MASSAILGVHDGHNAAAALLLDGTVVGAVQEERFTRIKNQGDVPHQSITTLIKSQSEPVRKVALDGLYMVHGGWTREVGHARATNVQPGGWKKSSNR